MNIAYIFAISCALILVSCAVHAAIPSAPVSVPTVSATAPPVMPSGSSTLVSVEPNNLLVPMGHIARLSPTQFSIRETIRAELPGNRSNEAEMIFLYRGATSKDVLLSSGEMRRQIGFKLRARNACNVVYVMWHIEPTQGIFVAVKSNPGQCKPAECGDRGYISVKAATYRKPSPIGEGQSRKLRARIDGVQISVWVDDVLAWQGDLPKEAFEFDGPVGLRSDNVSSDVEMKVSQ
jgi:hypothetical protein